MDCQIWTGSRKDNGHGQVYGVLSHSQRDRNGTRYAHRDAYLVAHGLIPDGYHVHHVCGETLCVNPDHLIAVSFADHARLHHANQPTCRSGKHLWTSESLRFQNGNRICRICRNERQKQWSRVNRDAEYWREYRKRKVTESGAASWREYTRWRKEEPPPT